MMQVIVLHGILAPFILGVFCAIIASFVAPIFHSWGKYAAELEELEESWLLQLGVWLGAIAVFLLFIALIAYGTGYFGDCLGAVLYRFLHINAGDWKYSVAAVPMVALTGGLLYLRYHLRERRRYRQQDLATYARSRRA